MLITLFILVFVRLIPPIEGLDIIDDGVGITGEREDPVALGLASMQERVSLLRGTFKISSQPMQGTRIQAVIPLAAR